MTLLHFGRVDAAVDVLTEGVANDPRNVEVYTTLDAALSARESPAPERAAALERYPIGGAAACAGLPAGAGESRERRHRSGRVVPRSIFPPEEGGTGPERVLVAARALAARAAATSGRCDAARPMVDGLTNIGPGMPLAPQAMTEASPRSARAARAGTRRVVVRAARGTGPNEAERKSARRTCQSTPLTASRTRRAG